MESMMERSYEIKPVFKINPKEREGKANIVHHNMLLLLKQDQEVLTRVNELEPEPEYGTVQGQTNDSGGKSDTSDVTVLLGSKPRRVGTIQSILKILPSSM